MEGCGWSDGQGMLCLCADACAMSAIVNALALEPKSVSVHCGIVNEWRRDEQSPEMDMEDTPDR